MIHGIHHLTFRAHDAVRTRQFYTQVLGLFQVKQTIRYEAVNEGHLYFGDQTGSAGTLVSAWISPGYQQGAVGKGQIATLALSIPHEAVDFWDKRLASLNIPAKYPQTRGNEVVIYLEDPDGLGIELVANDQDARPGIRSIPEIPKAMGIRGIHAAEIWLSRFDRTGAFLLQLGARLLMEQGLRFRYGWEDRSGSYVDIVWGREGAVGIAGAGALDHLGLWLDTETELWDTHTQLNRRSMPLGPIRELSYYRGFTARDPEGILYELNTAEPGFTLDEEPDQLGQMTTLPIWEIFRRDELLKGLPPGFQ